MNRGSWPTSTDGSSDVQVAPLAPPADSPPQRCSADWRADQGIRKRQGSWLFFFSASVEAKVREGENQVPCRQTWQKPDHGAKLTGQERIRGLVERLRRDAHASHLHPSTSLNTVCTTSLKPLTTGHMDGRLAGAPAPRTPLANWLSARTLYKHRGEKAPMWDPRARYPSCSHGLFPLSFSALRNRTFSPCWPGRCEETEAGAVAMVMPIRFATASQVKVKKKFVAQTCQTRPHTHAQASHTPLGLVLSPIPSTMLQGKSDGTVHIHRGPTPAWRWAT
ncbi:hypothetical protein XA68_10441 [Ophiocordyceps unilateralis]|uniref:Uncharacterized protein n=1 Tax=Ophiocordyceps unilateralis TaxID=268505 RepID=A0A2A9PIM2_OPHUN|nr:hypothetical protein XA68_10441 [Ophiocordyceps unilateralis]